MVPSGFEPIGFRAVLSRVEPGAEFHIGVPQVAEQYLDTGLVLDYIAGFSEVPANRALVLHELLQSAPSWRFIPA